MCIIYNCISSCDFYAGIYNWAVSHRHYRFIFLTKADYDIAYICIAAKDMCFYYVLIFNLVFLFAITIDIVFSYPGNIMASENYQQRRAYYSLVLYMNVHWRVSHNLKTDIEKYTVIKPVTLCIMPIDNTCLFTYLYAIIKCLLHNIISCICPIVFYINYHWNICCSIWYNAISCYQMEYGIIQYTPSNTHACLALIFLRHHSGSFHMFSKIQQDEYWQIESVKPGSM